MEIAEVKVEFEVATKKVYGPFSPTGKKSQLQALEDAIAYGLDWYGIYADNIRVGYKWKV